VGTDNLPTDDDCNPNVPGVGTSGDATATCACDFWGFVCEAKDQCSAVVCDCDPDCQDTCTANELLAPCRTDGHCDTYCPTGTDPDCVGDPDDGKFCS
jgi:hypothetical protein